MDTSDTIAIMGKIGEIHADLKQDIGNLGKEFGTFKGATKARLDGLESDAKRAEKRQWYHSIIVMPLLATMHGVAHRFGVNI